MMIKLLKHSKLRIKFIESYINTETKRFAIPVDSKKIFIYLKMFSILA